MSYAALFENHVYAQLGGLEMGDEFFALHPQLKKRLRAEALYHSVAKTPHKRAAEIVFTTRLQRIVRADRLEACRRPIPNIDNDWDIRR
jgi:hypothetical protein